MYRYISIFMQYFQGFEENFLLFFQNLKSMNRPVVPIAAGAQGYSTPSSSCRIHT